MGSTLQLAANHGLNLTTAAQGIVEIEKCLNKSIESISRRQMLDVAKTEEIGLTRYFCFTDKVEENFIRYKEIILFTNNIFCPQLHIKLHAIRLASPCKYSYWKESLFGEESDNDFEMQINRCKQIWPKTRSYAIEFVKKLKGDKLIYFEDDRFQIEVDTVNEGGTIEDMFNAMRLKWEPTKYSDITAGKIDNKVRNGWYYEVIQA